MTHKKGDQLHLFKDTSNRISKEQLNEYIAEMKEVVDNLDDLEVVPVQPFTVDEFHKHEVVDRAHILLEMLDTLLIDHPAVKQNKEIAEAAELAAQALWNLYQAAGRAYL